jgi:hypothetical protein
LARLRAWLERMLAPLRYRFEQRSEERQEARRSEPGAADERTPSE